MWLAKPQSKPLLHPLHFSDPGIHSEVATLRSGTFEFISSCHAAILKFPFHETLLVFTFLVINWLFRQHTVMLVLLTAIALEARIVLCEENTPRRRCQEMKYYLTSARYGYERLFENINCDKPMQDVPMYNAFERDIAVLNMFFGDSTVFGKSFGFFYP